MWKCFKLKGTIQIQGLIIIQGQDVERSEYKASFTTATLQNKEIEVQKVKYLIQVRTISSMGGLIGILFQVHLNLMLHALSIMLC